MGWVLGIDYLVEPVGNCSSGAFIDVPLVVREAVDKGKGLVLYWVVMEQDHQG